jgi:hypothetical protein
MYISAYGLLALDTFWFSKMVKMVLRGAGGDKDKSPSPSKKEKESKKTSQETEGASGRAVDKKQD